MRLTTLARARILRSVRMTDGCWASAYALERTGYVHFAYRDEQGVARTTTGHRAMYVAVHGEIDDSLHVDHLCRNRWCIRPSHLEAVTPTENNRRASVANGIRDARTHCPQGHPYDETNTYRRPGSRAGRNCRECVRTAAREYQRRQRAAARSTR